MKTPQRIAGLLVSGAAALALTGIGAGVAQAAEPIATIPDLTGQSTSVALDYHFDLDRFQPFIGASFGYNYGDSDVDETLFAGPGEMRAL